MGFTNFYFLLADSSKIAQYKHTFSSGCDRIWAALDLHRCRLETPFVLRDGLRVGEISRREKMIYSGTDPESYITEYTLVYEENEEHSVCDISTTFSTLSTSQVLLLKRSRSWQFSTIWGMQLRAG